MWTQDTRSLQCSCGHQPLLVTDCGSVCIVIKYHFNFVNYVNLVFLVLWSLPCDSGSLIWPFSNKVIYNFSRIDTQLLHIFNTMMVRHLSMVIVFQPESTLTTIVVKGNNCLWEASLWQCQGRVILTLPNDWGLRGDQQASVSSTLMN